MRRPATVRLGGALAAGVLAAAGAALWIPQASAAAGNLSIGAGADGSSKASGTSYGNVVDGDMSTYWSPNGTTGRISVKWGSATTVSSINIREAAGSEGIIGSRRVVNHDTGAVLASGTGAGVITFPATSLRKIDFEILSASGTPKVAEFETYADAPGPGPTGGTTSPPGGTTTRYEAENPPATCDGTIDSNHSGFSGSGFCNTTNSTGVAAQFTINAPSSGTATLGVRYANEGPSNRPANVAVNGSTVASASFAPTGSWDTWATQTLTVQVSSGGNTVRLTATGSAGLPNIDYLEFAMGGSLPPTTSPPTTPPVTTPPPTSGALYVSPNGSDSASGTLSDPTTLPSAISRVAPGGTIYMRGGTYRYSQTITIPPGNNGTSSARKTLSAYPGETPVLNFSAQSEDSSNRGLAIGGNWWHIYGIIVERAGDNGILLGGSNNIIERVVTRFNRDSGLQISRFSSDAPREQWPSNNLIISTESHDNADSDGEDADGFAPKLTTGSGNVFRYDVSHNNIDDGWDLYTKDDTGPIGVVTIENSLSYNNGTLSNGGQAGNGDRNGFKLGGEDIPVNHIVRGNIAYNNGKHGFTYNSNPGSMTISNNASIGNEERNFNFDDGSSVFRNNTSCDGGSNDRIVGDADSSNQFWSGSNGSRCSSYSGALAWHFAADGHLVVTFGGTQVMP
jgi:hypothetical protein